MNIFLMGVFKKEIKENLEKIQIMPNTGQFYDSVAGVSRPQGREIPLMTGRSCSQPAQEGDRDQGCE